MNLAVTGPARLQDRRTLTSELNRPSPLLFLVEGIHDVEFLKRISSMLSAADDSLPDLGQLERAGRLVFVPFGGGDVVVNAGRFSPLELREIHLYDREILPETARREAACRIVNAESRRRAFMTSKRALENYLHPHCIRAARGLCVAIADDCHVPDRVARAVWDSQHKPVSWSEIPTRARRKLREKVKHWLNREAVEGMTPELLDARDPYGEIRGWLATVNELLESPV